MSDLTPLPPNGGKRWRFKYRFDDKEKLLSLGVYPDISLKDARLRRDEARKLLAHFIDPGLQRKAHKEARLVLDWNSFEIVAGMACPLCAGLGRASWRPHPAPARAQCVPVDRQPGHQ